MHSFFIRCKLFSLFSFVRWATTFKIPAVIDDIGKIVGIRQTAKWKIDHRDYKYEQIYRHKIYRTHTHTHWKPIIQPSVIKTNEAKQKQQDTTMNEQRKNIGKYLEYLKNNLAAKWMNGGQHLRNRTMTTSPMIEFELGLFQMPFLRIDAEFSDRMPWSAWTENRKFTNISAISAFYSFVRRVFYVLLWA